MVKREKPTTARKREKERKREREREANPQMRSLIELRRKRNGIEAKGVEDKADTMPIPLLLLLDHGALEFVGADRQYCGLTGLDISIIREDASPIISRYLEINS